MSLRPLLQKNKSSGVYYFRKRIPIDLVAVIGKRELKHSLKTKDLKESKRLAALAELEA